MNGIVVILLGIVGIVGILYFVQQQDRERRAIFAGLEEAREWEEKIHGLDELMLEILAHRELAQQRLLDLAFDYAPHLSSEPPDGRALALFGVWSTVSQVYFTDTKKVEEALESISKTVHERSTPPDELIPWVASQLQALIDQLEPHMTAIFALEPFAPEEVSPDAHSSDSE